MAERGGEFIDNLHKTMPGYARRFGLTREEVAKPPGEVAYFVDGRRYAEASVVDEYRTFAPVIRADAAATSGNRPRTGTPPST